MVEDSKRICPVCDSEIAQNQDTCPECGVDLSLFDEEIEIDEEEAEESIEKVMKMVGEDDELVENFSDLGGSSEGSEERDEVADELIEDIKELGLSEEDISEEEDVAEIITFECPVCESEVSEDASECPNCGVIFEEDEEEDLSEDEADSEGLDIREEDILDEEVEIDTEISELEDESPVEETTEKMMADEEVLEVQKRLDSVKERIEDIDHPDVEVREIKRQVEKVESSLEEDKNVEEQIDELENQVDFANQIAEKVDRSRNYLEWLSSHIDITKGEKQIKKVKKGCRIGEYRVATKKAAEVEQKLKDASIDHDLTKEKNFKDFMERKKEEIQKKLSEIEDLEISREHEEFEKEFDKIPSLKEEDFLDSFHRIMDLLKRIDRLSEISLDLNKTENYIERLEEMDVKIGEYQEKMGTIKDKVEEGHHEKAKEMSEEIKNQVKKRLKEKKAEKERKRKDRFKKIQQMIPRIKELLQTAEEFGIDIEEGKKLIDEAMDSTKDNSYVEAINSLNECKIFFQKRLDNEIGEEIENIESESSSDKVESILQEIKTTKKEEDYEKVYELIEEAKHKIESEKEPEEKEEIEEPKIDFSFVESMIEQAQEYDFGFPEASELIDEAKELHDKGNFDESEEHLEEAEKKISERLPHLLRKEIKEAKEDLKNAKIKGAEISEPVQLLKEINESMKRDNLRKSFEKLKEYKKKMDDIKSKYDL